MDLLFGEKFVTLNNCFYGVEVSVDPNIPGELGMNLQWDELKKRWRFRLSRREAKRLGQELLTLAKQEKPWATEAT